MKSINDEELHNLGYYSANGDNQALRKRMKTILEVGFLVFIWYFTAVITITTSKEIMNRFQLPFLLCTIQFSFASILTYVYLTFTGQYKHLTGHIYHFIYQISGSYTLGFILTNWAFSIVAPAFAEMVKSSEPISTVVIGWFFLNENVSYRTYSTLIPVCLGIGISCYHDDAFSMLGFLLSAASNFCFSSRAVLTKRMNLQYPEGVDDINMFFNISLYGLLLLVPVTIAFEGSTILDLLDRYYFSPSKEDTNASVGGFHFTQFLLLFLLNGSLFTTYNLTSYVVLRKTDLITHSVLNAFRRVFIIVFTTLYFSAHLSIMNLVGILLAVTGVILFGYFRSNDKKSVNQ
eukprot:gene11001-11988_t